MSVISSIHKMEFVVDGGEVYHTTQVTRNASTSGCLVSRLARPRHVMCYSRQGWACKWCTRLDRGLNVIRALMRLRQRSLRLLLQCLWIRLLI